jgi:hypothetical protein
MDNLFVHAKRPRILISSSGLKDLSKKIPVGADEMLVNAINQTNLKSNAYVFLDQSFEKEVGQLEWLSPTKTRKKPRFYFRGAITQLDTNTVNDKSKVSLDFADAPHPFTINGGALEKSSPNFNKAVSIVSVDLHLVSYPDKTILPGGSVANSMVVTNRTLGTGASGLIKLTGYNMTLSFERIESIGQAVRNLIELGTIELLGRHAKVPYWRCLNIEPTNEKLENGKRANYSTTPKQMSVLEVQKMLAKLGHYTQLVTGRMNLETHAALAKFQASESLIATGDLNYDVYARLQQKFKGYVPNGRKFKRKPSTLFESTYVANTGMKRQPGRHLALSSTKNQYKMGDKLMVNIKSNVGGFITCFHQSGTDTVTQILPTDSHVRLQVTPNYVTLLPAKTAGFTLRFETAQKPERIMCTLQDSNSGTKSPFDSRFKRLRPIPVKRLEDIPNSFSKFGGLKDWVILSRTASS